MFRTKPQEQETVGNVSTIFQSHCIKDVKKKHLKDPCKTALY